MVQGNICCVILDRGAVQGDTHPKRVASPYILQRSRSTSSFTPDSMASGPSLSACRHLNSQLWNFLHYLIFGPSYGMFVSTIFASSPVSFTFFWLPVLVREKVPSNAWTFRVGICLPWLCHESLYTLKVMYTFPALGGSPLPFRKSTAINLPSLCKVS